MSSKMVYTGKNESESWISHMSNKVKTAGGINLAQGIPGFNPPEQLLRILSRKSLEKVHQYPPGNGHPALIDQICASYRQHTDVDRDEVLILQGATEGISLVYTYMMKMYGNGWSALGFDPLYESYGQLPSIFNNRLIRVPFDEGSGPGRPRLEQYLEKGDVKLVFVNSPGNPFGRIWTEDDFKWIFHLADKYDFRVLLDAVYKDLYFGDKAPYIPIKGNKQRLFYVNSFSKMLSITGWRIGYLITNREDMVNIRAIHDYIGLCAPSVLQYSISDYLEQSGYAADYTRNIRRKLSGNYSLARQILGKSGFNVEPAGGGYFLWCRLPAGYSSGVDFAIELYEKQKVGIVPGIHFSGKAGSYVRINIAREEDELKEGLDRIGFFMLR